MSIQVIEEEFPFGHIPAARFIFAPPECAGEGGDQIELATELRQRFKRGNPMGHALHPEQLNQLVRDRIKIDIDADSSVAELFREKKEKAGAAAEIENFFRR